MSVVQGADASGRERLPALPAGRFALGRFDAVTADLYGYSYFESRRGDWRRAQMMQQECMRLFQQGALPSSGTVLDVGCGMGEFLGSGWFDQWDRYGIEPADHARNHCVKDDVCCFDLPDGDCWADLVVMRGVLQHLPNPYEALRDAVSRLKPGGYLAVLSTPNRDSWVYRFLGGLPCLDPPRNYQVPSARSLQVTLQELGLDVVSMRFPYLGTPYARPLKDAFKIVRGKPAPWFGNMVEIVAKKP